MKTKTIFKMLAAAMLMPTMLLTTACSNNDDEIVNTENPASTKGYALPVTVNVTRGGDATRATFDGSKLNFSAGDKLFVGGNYDDWNKRFAGTLDYDAESGKFKGTIYTQDDTYKTYEDLFGNSDYTIATLLPAGYKDHGYLVINTNDPDAQYDDFIEESNEYTLATSKADGVAQFSYEKSSYYDDGFALSPENAILNFTITGLAASTSVNVSLKSMAYNITGTVTTDASGTATFAAGINDGLNLQPFSLTVGGKNITIVSSDKVVEAGKIYNISRSAKAHALSTSVVGEIVGSDGMAYAVADKDKMPSGVTAAGMVAYKNGSNGLVIALADEANTMNWSTATGASGAAAHTPVVTGGTWKLPSKAEWNQMFGDDADADIANYMSRNDAIITAGGTGLQNALYWSSTEFEDGIAYEVELDSGSAYWHTNGDEDNEHCVRACLAF